MDRIARLSICAAGLLALSGSAHARSMQLAGTAGYLSEWEIRASLASEANEDSFSGPLTVTHVGLCSPNGPVEKSGQMTLRISKLPATKRVSLMLSFGGVRCTYDGPMSDSVRGSMDCSDAQGVPLAVTVK